MSSKTNAAWMLLPALLAVGPADAATYGLWQGASPSLAAGASFTAAFDTHLLFDPAMHGIETATLTLNFIGAEQRVRGESTTIATASGGGYTAYDFIDNYADTLDTALVLLDGTQPGMAPKSVSSTHYQADVVRSTQAVGYYQTSCNLTGCNTNYVSVGTNRYIDHVAGYKGAFSYATQLDAAQLARFSADGVFRYGFTVAQGGVQLASADMVFSTSPVPEPHAVTLAAAGLALLGALARRRQAAGRSGDHRI